MLRQTGTPEAELAVLASEVEAAERAAREAEAQEDRQWQAVHTARARERKAQLRVSGGDVSELRVSGGGSSVSGIQLTFEQFRELVRAGSDQQLSDAGLRQLFEEMDADDSGTISAMEFAAHSAKQGLLLQGTAAVRPKPLRQKPRDPVQGVAPSPVRTHHDRRQLQKYRNQLQGIWRRNGVAEGKDADALLRKWQGREEELLGKVRRKYEAKAAKPRCKWCNREMPPSGGGTALPREPHRSLALMRCPHPPTSSRHHHTPLFATHPALFATHPATH